MIRPKFLTIWLAFMAIANFFSLFSYTLGSAAITQVFPAMNQMMLGIFVLLLIVNLVAVFLLWTWKIAGFYIAIASAIVATFLNIMIMGSGGVTAVIGAAIGIGILYLAMRPVWQQFR